MAKPYDYERDAETGEFHFLLYGQRTRGSRPYPTEEAARAAVKDSYEEQAQADADELRYHVQ
jgi:hypothetical protein